MLQLTTANTDEHPTTGDMVGSGCDPPDKRRALKKPRCPIDLAKQVVDSNQ